MEYISKHDELITAALFTYIGKYILIEWVETLHKFNTGK